MDDATAANYRKCRVCGYLLPISSFRENPSCRGGYEPTCKGCKKIRMSQKPLKKSSQDINLDALSNDVLIAELRRRGWAGEIKFVKTVNI